jgi:hypothetical protein
MKKIIVPFGIKTICSIYIFNAVLYSLLLIFFHNNIYILGKKVPPALSLFSQSLLVLIPVYLFFVLKKLRIEAWFIAVFFQCFFLANNLLQYLEHEGFGFSLIRTAGLNENAALLTPMQIWVLVLNSALNLAILLYLLKNMVYFKFRLRY